MELKRYEYQAEELGIDMGAVDKPARETVAVLQQAGYQSWLVGGCVRDLMLHRRPKDFDLVTSARPEEIHRLFRRSRKIGKRFVIMHVLYGPGWPKSYLEVSTLRRSPKESGQADNVWSKRLEDDVQRRDFTANALYMDPMAQTVIDFVGGVPDIREKILRVVGVPEQRFREDPVRILRLARFAARYGFSAPPEEMDAMKKVAPLLESVNLSRKSLEVGKLFAAGYAVQTMSTVREFGLLTYFLPDPERFLSVSEQQLGYAVGDFWDKALSELDQKRVKHLADWGTDAPQAGNWGGLLSALLWPYFFVKMKDKHGTFTEITAKIALRENQIKEDNQNIRDDNVDLAEIVRTGIDDFVTRLIMRVWSSALPDMQLQRMDMEHLHTVWGSQLLMAFGRVPRQILQQKHFQAALWLASLRQQMGDEDAQGLDLEYWQQQHSKVYRPREKSPRSRSPHASRARRGGERRRPHRR